jgi:ribosomal protein S12 methylthiotransferase
MLELKRQGAIRGVIVSGCLAEREQATLLEKYPEIDHLVGVFGREEIAKAADRLIGGLTEQRLIFHPAPARPLPDTARLRITPRHFAYLKISEGCDRLCTFCAIPRMRGKHATKPIEEVVAEARELADSGARELIVVAQDTTYYGKDLYGEPRLADLIVELNRIEGIVWIRLMYLYPMYFSERLIDTIGDCEKVISYLDVPLQHINDRVLRRMQRRVNRRETERLLDTLRNRIPHLALRTTFITGFPGESDEEFEELVDFVREQQFERMGAFAYSFEPDTPAARIPGHVPEVVKQDRRDRLMAEQQRIAFAWSARQIGRQLDVIIDAPSHDPKHDWLGRSYADAPDVDCLVYVRGRQPARGDIVPGDIVPCEIVAGSGYDLIAVPQ